MFIAENKFPDKIKSSRQFLAALFMRFRRLVSPPIFFNLAAYGRDRFRLFFLHFALTRTLICPFAERLARYLAIYDRAPLLLATE